MKIEFDVTPAQFSALEAVGQNLRCSPGNAAKVMAFMTANTDFDGLERFIEHADVVADAVDNGGLFYGSHQTKVGGCISVPPARRRRVKGGTA